MVSPASDPLGTAMLDYQRRGAVRGRCVYRDGATVQDGRVEEHYFTPREEWSEDTLDRLRTVEGPVLDVGCGAGQHSVWFQDHGEAVVAFDVSPGAVECARERGVEDARVLDMFAVDEAFPRDRFRTAWTNGTQLGLAGSLAGARSLLSSLAAVTDDGGIAVVDNYRPRQVDEDLFGYRPDPRDGVAHRCFHFEYFRDPDARRPGDPGSDDRGEGGLIDAVGDGTADRERLVGRTLHFLLFGPDRLRDAVVGTPWAVDRVDEREYVYKAILRKA